MAQWRDFPYDDTDYSVDTATLRKQWPHLHIGDAEPLPKEAAVLAAWALCHAGAFQQAYNAGLKAAASGHPGWHHGRQQGASDLRHLPGKERKTRLAMFQEVADRAEAQAAADPKNAGALYAKAAACQAADAMERLDIEMAKAELEG